MAWVTKRRVEDGSWRYTSVYRDRAGRQRSAGTFRVRHEAERAGTAAEIRMAAGSWVDRQAGRVTFAAYVETSWWPSRHLEVTTRAAYRSNLDRHFLPFFGDYPLGEITPPLVQAWVRAALEGGLSPRSVVTYHTVLHGILKRAVLDRVIAFNPCEATDLPKVVVRRRRIITPDEFDRLLAEILHQHRALVLTGIETGMRWGELAALRPTYLDLGAGCCGWRRPSSRSPARTPPPASVTPSRLIRRTTSRGS
jgi:integrase